MAPKRKAAGPPAIKSAKKAKCAATSANAPSQATGKTTVDSIKDDKIEDQTLSQAPDDKKGEWVLLNGDKREPLIRGENQPERLTITAQHRVTGNKKVYKFKRSLSFDWNNAEHIKDANIWRRQTFYRSLHMSLKRPKAPWIPYETAYLELFHKKVRLRTQLDNEVGMPETGRICNAFNVYFQGRADLTDANGKSVGARAQREKSSVANYMRRKGSYLAQIRKELSGLKIHIDESSWMPTITDDEIEAYLENRKVSAETSQQTKEKGRSRQAAKGGLEKTSAVGEKISLEELGHLAEDGWTVPKLPQIEGEATHQGKQNVRFRVEDTWSISALEALKDRLKRNQDLVMNEFSERNAYRERWFRDPDSKRRTRSVAEVAQKGSDRHPDAAAVNGLLGVAIVPPLGYQGDIHALVGQRILPEAELVIAEMSADAMKLYHSRHDKEFERLMAPYLKKKT